MVRAQQIDPSLLVEDRAAGEDKMKRYFLIRHRPEPAAEPKEYGLLLVLPGGPGSAEFLPLCANGIAKYGVPEDFAVAQLVAPVWDAAEAKMLVWPGAALPSTRAKFTSERFIDAVIDDVGARLPVKAGRVFTLGWSSSGHVLYSSALTNPRIGGSFIAMARFYPAAMAQAEKARGKRFYFWHSPDDPICPYGEAEMAAKFLEEKGALTVLRSYKGGHGWVPNTFWADRIREAVEWFSVPDAEAKERMEKLRAGR